MKTHQHSKTQKRVALVTGSTSGIGAAIAKRLSDEGISVVINSKSSQTLGKQLAETLPDAIYLNADVAEEEQCKGLIHSIIERYGQIDMLINNAVAPGVVVPHHDLQGATDELFERNFTINLMGPWYLSRFALPYLKLSNTGVIVNVSSIAGVRPVGSSIPYAISKAALNHLTLLLAKVAAPEVRVNAIAPGFIETQRTTEPGFDYLREIVAKKSFLKKSGTPEAIADAVLGIINCNYMTGEVIVVDGGTILS